jgi:hypothetical protein
MYLDHFSRDVVGGGVDDTIAESEHDMTLSLKREKDLRMLFSKVIAAARRCLFVLHPLIS